MSDAFYQDLRQTPQAFQDLQEHKNVRLFHNPWALSALARLGLPDTQWPQVGILVRQLYQFLSVQLVDHILPLESVEAPTRMQATEGQSGVYRGQVAKRQCPVAIVDLMRGGILPSQVIFETLHAVLDPSKVWQDHVFCQRTVDSSDRVDGVEVSGIKSGGSIEDAVVVIPDPMGATGSSLCHIIDHYKRSILGTPRAWVALHLVITPEYIQKVTGEHPDLHIMACRLDRGMSDSSILALQDLSDLSYQKGLNQRDYIVPGLGGVGELLNNTDS